MTFEKWVDNNSAKVRPLLYIRKAGMLSWSVGARKKWELDRFKFVVVWYDPEMGRIGLEFLAVEMPSSYPIRNHSATPQISCRSYLNFYDIRYKTNRKIELRKHATRDDFYTAQLPSSK